MLNPRLRFLAVILLAVLAVAGCATQPPPPQQTPPSGAELDALRPSGDTAAEVPEPLGPAKPLSPLDDPNSPLYNKVVYFDYDTAEIRPQDTDLLRTHAAYIYRTPGVTVTLEGHTDERGTRDYNLALGDRRADAVQQFLVAEGVPPEKLRRLSYGEERPAESGSTERAWALNRRVELVY
ncbi:MAG: peptidoglycan-associated lipoprotein Pal [Thiohalocapsa sp.]|jgi:peptidoglycan-associated lipoprotein|uniref:peptidoglycan-associated lipoprotein Pal n=1 Tax=Thiohalocapsa sp. TaxID=2497641 RepID=UPI0025CBB17E|nr:peptidoglycan-associated lipoprotein Pal [Thiohalocapsa sp.]MCG6942680.1 peptidoglycan-associated lipoprotein Pal [Thiohalocapsa sp.]